MIFSESNLPQWGRRLRAPPELCVEYPKDSVGLEENRGQYGCQSNRR